MRLRYIVFAVSLFLALVPTAHADSGDCDNFRFVRSVIASEATRQPLQAQILIGHAVITHGLCHYDPNFYAGLREANRARDAGQYGNWHFRSYYNLDSIGGEVGMQIALAAHIALTEPPRIVRHFDNAGSMAAWWTNPRSCPDGWFVVGEVKFC